MKFIVFSTLLLSSLAAARPSLRHRAASSSQLPNGISAINLSATPSATSPTTPMPNMTSIPRGNSSTSQDSLTLLASVIAPNFAYNGTNTSTPEAGEYPSLTSTNNFINWCASLPELPITNGQQLRNGSCNPAPIGAIPSVANMPSSKFVSPTNLAVIPGNTTFQITLAVKNLETGFFTNPDTNFLAAPQQLNQTTGQIKGHAHVVIESLESLNQTTPTDPTKFAFFIALNNKADARGQLYANVTNGLPQGVYKMSAILSGANHQPVVLPVAQHGTSNDVVYFTVTAPANGKNTPTTPTATPTGTLLPTQPAHTSQPTQTSQPTHVSQALTSGIPTPTETVSAGDPADTC